MAEGLQKINQTVCGRKLSQSPELEYYPDATGEKDLKFLIIYKVCPESNETDSRKFV